MLDGAVCCRVVWLGRVVRLDRFIRAGLVDSAQGLDQISCAWGGWEGADLNMSLGTVYVTRYCICHSALYLTLNCISHSALYISLDHARVTTPFHIHSQYPISIIHPGGNELRIQLTPTKTTPPPQYTSHQSPQSLTAPSQPPQGHHRSPKPPYNSP